MQAAAEKTRSAEEARCRVRGCDARLEGEAKARCCCRACREGRLYSAWSGLESWFGGHSTSGEWGQEIPV